MNCKQGDLAVVVSSANCKNFGKIVRCIRIATRKEKFDAMLFAFMDEVFWVTDARLLLSFIADKSPAGFTNLAMDSALRPIRDNDGEDETLQWAPVPTKETA